MLGHSKSPLTVPSIVAVHDPELAARWLHPCRDACLCDWCANVRATGLVAGRLWQDGLLEDRSPLGSHMVAWRLTEAGRTGAGKGGI